MDISTGGASNLCSNETDAYSKCQDKVLEWQKRTQEFTKENNFKRDFTREYVSNFDYRTLEDKKVKISEHLSAAENMKESGKFSGEESIEKNKKMKRLKSQLGKAKSFLERAKIQNEITALENGYNSFQEYQDNKNVKLQERALIKTSDGYEYKVIEKDLENFANKHNLNTNDSQNSNPLLQEIYAKEKNFDSKIKILTKEEYSKIDSIELSRVVTGKNKKESDNIIKNTINGEIKYSNEKNSYYGKGIYFGDSKIENKLVKEFGNKNSSIMKCKISKEAKILEINDIQDYISNSNKLARGIKNNQLCNFYNTPAKNRNILFMNAGFDILKIKKENYYVILNRGVLITYDK